MLNFPTSAFRRERGNVRPRTESRIVKPYPAVENSEKWACASEKGNVRFGLAVQAILRFGRRRDRFGAAMALVTALVVAFQLLRPAPAELMQNDSQTYLDFSATRTAGYPLFLRLVEHLPRGLDAVPWIQLGVYGLAAVLLAGAFRRLAKSNLAGGLLLVLLLGNGEVTRLSFMIMTESLFLACLMLLLALFCRLAQMPSWRTLALASFVAGLAVLIRPAGYALLTSLPVVAWWSWGDALPARQTILAAILPCLAVLGGGMAAYHAEHGHWQTQSFLGFTLLGKAAAVVDAAQPGTDPEIIRWMAAAVAPDRAVIDRAPTMFDRFFLQSPYYDIWRETLAETLPAEAGTATDDPIALDQAMLRVSLAVIAAAPRAYLAEVALNFVALWWLPDAMTHLQLARFRAFLASLGPLPDLGQYPAWHREHNDAVIWALHGFMMMALATSLWWGWRVAAGAVGRAPLPPLARLGFVAALMAHASFLLTASLQAGMPRYAWGMWPALSILFVTGLLVCAQGVRQAWAARRQPKHG
jgi:hypothetical protein